jgi:hypothetical protein
MSNRPTQLLAGETLYWIIPIYDSSGVLVDADSTPTVSVRKNGASVADVVTVTKRSATTGLYDASYNPAGETEDDCFQIEETATISSQAYYNSFSVKVVSAERGTDLALLAADKPTNFDLLAINGSGEVTTSNPATGGGSNHTAQDVANLVLGGTQTPIVTNGTGQVEASNMRGTDNASTFDHTTNAVITDTASRDASKADVSGLATQTSVDSIDTDVQAIGSDVSAILTDTNELQLNQGNWLTATGFSTHNAGDVATAILVTPVNKLATDASGNVEANNMRGTDGANTVAPDNASITAILADTNELQQNQGDWATATGFATHSAADVANLILVTPSNKLATDVAGDVAANNMRGTDNAILAASAPANWSTLIVGTGADAGKVTTSNPAAGSGSSHTAQDVADLILVTPANKLATDSSGNVEANNMRGTDGANTVAPDNASVAAILADTNELQLNQGDWATATGFATHSATDVANLILVTPINKLATDASGNVEANNMRGTDGANTIAPVDVSADVASILADTNELQLNQGNWLTATGFSTHNVSDVTTAMQAVSGDFKADVSGLATQASVNTIDANVDLVLADTNELQLNQGDWLTATGFSVHDANDVVSAMQAVSDDFKADTSLLARESSVSDVKSVTDKLDTAMVLDGSVYQFTANALANSSGGDTAAAIYEYFIDASRADLFKADVSDVIRKGVSLRYTNNGTGAGFDDVTITDAP